MNCQVHFILSILRSCCVRTDLSNFLPIFISYSVSFSAYPFFSPLPPPFSFNSPFWGGEAGWRCLFILKKRFFINTAVTNPLHSTEAISVVPKSGWELKVQTSAVPKDQWGTLLNGKSFKWLYTPLKENKRSNGKF